MEESHGQARTTQAHEAVLEAVARAQNVDTLELEEPLYNAIDPDALNGLVESGSEGLSITFDYHGTTVTIDDDLTVKIKHNPLPNL